MSENKKLELVSHKGDFQTTISKKVRFTGHSPYIPKELIIELLPSKADSGIVFEVDGVIIPALIEYAKNDDSVHTTSLVKDGKEIKTVEHLLSAIWGMGIDNLLIKVDETGHLPFLDASAQGFAQLIQKVGTKKQTSLRKYVKVLERMEFIEDPKDERKAVFVPSDSLDIESTTAFEEPVGRKTVKFHYSESSYQDEISWARTFLRSPLDDEGKVWDFVKKLFPHIPIDPEESPIIVYNKEKFITPLRAADEPARHKVLDFIGDIALLGNRVIADINLNLPGHKFTRQIVRDIKPQIT
jgi:UDP-3-O-[3-hydroxymyristoyl] N-acetylglucosamine deacetylase